MRFLLICFAPPLFAIALLPANLFAQADGPMTRLKPLGAPSAVDQFRRDRAPQRSFRAAADASVRGVSHQVRVASAGTTKGTTAEQSIGRADPAVRQTVWMQSDFQAPPLGGGGMSLPGDTGASPPALPPGEAPPGQMPPGQMSPGQLPDSVPYPQASQPAPPSQPPSAPRRSLPSPQAAPASPSDDFAPMAPPRLQTNEFAGVDNCNLVTGPSPYMAASVFSNGCGQVVPTSYVPVGCAPPVNAPPPVALPPEIPSAATVPPVSVLPPVASTITAAPARSLISFGQERNVVQVGQGLWGQPVAYVPGQHLRNWLRYFSP